MDEIRLFSNGSICFLKWGKFSTCQRKTKILRHGQAKLSQYR